MNVSSKKLIIKVFNTKIINGSNHQPAVVSQFLFLQCAFILKKHNLFLVHFLILMMSNINANKRKMDDVITVPQVVDFIKTLAVADLKILSAEIVKQILGKAMDLNTKQFEDKFEIFDNGETNDADGNSFDDVFPDWVHSYTLKWKSDGVEMSLKLANQEGLMWAGTTKYEVQAMHIGPLQMARSFPDGARLPNYLEGMTELTKMLNARGFDSEDQIYSFVGWVIDNVFNGPTDNLQNDVRNGELFQEFSYEECLGQVCNLLRQYDVDTVLFYHICILGMW
jgi:hypothetical protein